MNQKEQKTFCNILTKVNIWELSKGQGSVMPNSKLKGRERQLALLMKAAEYYRPAAAWGQNSTGKEVQ